ncbi:hypothetical protein T484DRAFT_2505090 [Baffinella frigidus]|nr:hypothetical protein T484DRAFT_2505090 [Cryptophyta sp. CCMP2293]
MLAYNHTQEMVLDAERKLLVWPRAWDDEIRFSQKPPEPLALPGPEGSTDAIPGTPAGWLTARIGNKKKRHEGHGSGAVTDRGGRGKGVDHEVFDGEGGDERREYSGVQRDGAEAGGKRWDGFGGAAQPYNPGRRRIASKMTRLMLATAMDAPGESLLSKGPDRTSSVVTAGGRTASILSNKNNLALDQRRSKGGSLPSVVLNAKLLRQLEAGLGLEGVKQFPALRFND